MLKVGKVPSAPVSHILSLWFIKLATCAKVSGYIKGISAVRMKLARYIIVWSGAFHGMRDEVQSALVTEPRAFFGFVKVFSQLLFSSSYWSTGKFTEDPSDYLVNLLLTSCSFAKIEANDEVFSKQNWDYRCTDNIFSRKIGMRFISSCWKCATPLRRNSISRNSFR